MCVLSAFFKYFLQYRFAITYLYKYFWTIHSKIKGLEWRQMVPMYYLPKQLVFENKGKQIFKNHHVELIFKGMIVCRFSIYDMNNWYFISKTKRLLIWSESQYLVKSFLNPTILYRSIFCDSFKNRMATELLNILKLAFHLKWLTIDLVNAWIRVQEWEKHSIIFICILFKCWIVLIS